MSCIDPEIGKLKESFDLLEDPKQRETFDNHIKVCGHCRTEVEQLQLFAESVRQEFARHISEAHLFEFATGDLVALPESMRDQIEHHLNFCAECREVYEEYRDWAAQVDAQIPFSMPAPPPSLGLIDKEARIVASRVMEMAGEAGLITDQRESAPPRYNKTQFWLTTAAAILAIAVAGLVFFSERSTVSPGGQVANSNVQETQQTERSTKNQNGENRNTQRSEAPDRSPDLALSKPPDRIDRNSTALRSGSADAGVTSLRRARTISIDKQQAGFDERLRASLKEQIEKVTRLRIIDEDKQPDARLRIIKSSDRQYAFEIISGEKRLFRHRERLKDRTAEEADLVAKRVAHAVQAESSLGRHGK